MDDYYCEDKDKDKYDDDNSFNGNEHGIDQAFLDDMYNNPDEDMHVAPGEAPDEEWEMLPEYDPEKDVLSPISAAIRAPLAGDVVDCAIDQIGIQEFGLEEWTKSKQRAAEQIKKVKVEQKAEQKAKQKEWNEQKEEGAQKDTKEDGNEENRNEENRNEENRKDNVKPESENTLLFRKTAFGERPITKDSPCPASGVQWYYAPSIHKMCLFIGEMPNEKKYAVMAQYSINKAPFFELKFEIVPDVPPNFVLY